MSLVKDVLGEAGLKSYWRQGDLAILHGDCRNVCRLLPKESLDLILSDPPYVPGFDWAWGLLARAGWKLLRPDRNMMFLLGQINLEKAFVAFHQFRQRRGLDDAAFRYWWTVCMTRHESPQPYLGLNLLSRWKPALWYVKGKRRKRMSRPADWHSTPHREKGGHPWQQSLGWFCYWLGQLSKPKELVLDPFLGGGTTLVACKMLGRAGIGIEVDERSCETSARRLERFQSLGLCHDPNGPLRSKQRKLAGLLALNGHPQQRTL